MIRVMGVAFARVSTPICRQYALLGNRVWENGRPREKPGFEKTPPRREVGIAYRQPPQRMQVVRQDTNGDGVNRQQLLHRRVAALKASDVADNQIA